MIAATRHEGHHDDDETGSELWITNDNVMLAHGIIMLLAWALCSHVGNILGRYFRKANITYWFPAHVTLQASCAIMTMIGFILIVAHIGYGGRDHFDGLHQIVGLIIIILLLLQILLGIAAHQTWYEGKPKGPLDKWHWWIGRLLWLLALFNILTGVSLQEDTQFSTWMLMTFLYIILVISVVIMDIYVHRDADDNGNDDDSDDSDADADDARSSYYFKYIMGVFFIILIIIFAIMLCFFS